MERYNLLSLKAMGIIIALLVCSFIQSPYMIGVIIILGYWLYHTGKERAKLRQELGMNED